MIDITKSSKWYWRVPVFLIFLFFAHPSFSQTVVKGTVTDENGLTLPGVSVTSKENPSVGTSTDANGQFKFNITKEKTLVFRFIGYQPQSVVINGRAVINVKMIPERRSLDEVVVVGYGTVKKGDLTGSVSTVTAENLNRTVNQSFIDALDGRAAGVKVSTGEGTPGGEMSIKIRGGTSISASNEPLYVVDGFPIIDEKTVGGTTGFASTSSNALASINPSDIESIQILKDASATAIYGSRGANGVVIITTKSGKVGKPTVSFESNTTTKQITKKLDLLDAVQYAQYRKTQWAAVPTSETYIRFQDPESFRGTGTDWQDAIYRTAFTKNNRLSINGGTKETRYNVSLGTFSDEGIIVGSSFNRYDGRINLNGVVSPKLKYTAIVTGSFTKQVGAPTGGANGERAGAVTASLIYPPVALNLDDQATSDLTGLQTFSPIAILNNSQIERKSDLFLGNFALDYSINKSLVLRSTFGANINNSRGSSFFNNNTGAGAFVNGRANIDEYTSRSVVNENTLTYTKKFNKQSLTALGGFTVQSANIEQFGVTNTAFDIQDLGFDNIAFGTLPQIPTSDTQDWALASGLARVNYDYDQRYLLTASFRADGSSRFAKGNKWGYFPAVAAAWKISNESFLKNQKVVSDLKLRAGYGVTGNQEVPRYRSLSSMGIDYYSFGLANGLATIATFVDRVANPNLTWELTKQLNLGVDFGFFNNRLTGSVDVYNKRTSDMLLAINLIPTAGIGAPALKNIGGMNNKGLEIALSSINISKKNFSWKTDFNISFNKNEILDLGPYSQLYFDIASANHTTINEVILQPEGSIGTFYGYQTAGIYGLPDNATPAQIALAGRRIFVDQNKDGVINADDRVVLGNALPKHYGGLTNDFSYKNFDLSIFMNWSYGNKVYNGARGYLEENLSDGRNKSTAILNAWTPTNQNTDIAAINKSEDSRFMDRFLEDGSFLRLKSVAVGYNFDSKLLKNTFIKTAKISVSGQNLFTLTNYKGYNPEANVSNNPVTPGIDWGAYPIAKMLTLGLNLTF